MAEVDLRLLRYFVAVAEERNFTRAAERLMMTQPALSRAVRALESAVGAPLFERGYRDVTLTEPGEVLLARARSLDEQAAAAIRLARRAATAEPHVRVTGPGCDVAVLTTLVSTFNQSRPRVPAVSAIVDPDLQADQLRDGTADIGLMRRAVFDEEGLDSDEIFSESRLVVVRDDYPLATRRAVRMSELTDMPVIRWGGTRQNGFILWPPDEIPSMRWTAGPVIRETSEFLAMVLLGEGIGFVPASIAAMNACPGVRAVPVLDCPPSTVRLAWRKGSASRSVAALIWHASSYTDWLDRPADLVAPVRHPSCRSDGPRSEQARPVARLETESPPQSATQCRSTQCRRMTTSPQ